ncbi:MAG: SDR family NAD(P)-dependent oxidoreductase [Bacteroidales bacterium]|nr:SDR family NAD(P)-dependent oxidoreductase [Bacteroidales bacterium]
MKQKIKEIYQDLSSGKLTQKEALGKIKTLKLQEQGEKNDILFSIPVWEPSIGEVSPDLNNSRYIEQYIILCELPNINIKQVENLVPRSHCILLQTDKQKNIAERYNEYALTSFELIQKILKGKPQGKIFVQIVIGDEQEETLLVGLSGLLKTAALENPMLIGQVILTTPQTSAEILAKQFQREQVVGHNAIIKYEQETRYVLRWKEIETSQDEPKIVFKDQGSYLITGGLGSLGILLAKEILQQTKKARVILTDRSELTSKKQSFLGQLSTETDRVVYKQLDICDLNQVQQLIASVNKEHKSLNGIIHCAGMVSDNFIIKKTSTEFRQVLEPKVLGTYNLDQASQNIDLDFFVLFSSVASVGNVGQADYATANAFMDQFAAYRNKLRGKEFRKGNTLSINWPLWQEGGMIIDQAKQDMMQQTMGLQSISNITGMFAFYRSLELQHAQMMVLKGNLSQIRRTIIDNQNTHSETSKAITKEEQFVVAEINSGSLLEKTQNYLCKEFSGMLSLPAHKIDPQASLEKYGIDSILAMNLTSQLEKTFGTLSKTLFFEYQTISELAEYFSKTHLDKLSSIFNIADNSQKISVNKLSEQKPLAQNRTISGHRFNRQNQTSALANSTRSIVTDPIAIIGLSGRFPEAHNIEEFWHNLRDGKDCIIEVPKERWDWRDYYSEDRTKSGQHFSKWGGFIAGVDEFDPRFFNISPREAENIDPQERLFLQHAWMAIEDAGYTRAGLQIAHEQDLAGQVGVYVGVMWGEYQLFGAEAGTQGKRMGIGNSYASIANRVSYVFNLHGPSMTLDTMCSSSLTAIHLACQDLKLGRTSLAIAGGVNVSIHPNKYLILSAGQFISSDGHCQSFGEGGDGYIPGEGVGVVILKRLSEAQRDGDHIYGILRGSALNHGGKTNGYSVPNPNAQAAAISRALAESNINARHISYLEAHGTGTKLGDPIEITALSQAFKKHTRDSEFCLIGSAKSNIGHCESAAGIAGLAKVLLQMQYKQIVPSLHSVKLNPYIDFQKTPFIVNQTLRTWEQPVIDGQVIPRIAGLSSFGAGGSNAHIIIQEYVSSVEASQSITDVEQNAKVIILLSARTKEQLKQKVKDLLGFIHKHQPDLVSLAYTLQVGRESMEERLGFMVGSIDQLANKLQAYIRGEQDIEDSYMGQVKREKDTLPLDTSDDDLQQTVEKWIDQKKLSKLKLWVKGLDIDWGKLYGDKKPHRISLPTYPFAKERYWVDTVVRGQLGVAGKTTAVLHPLLHTNTSDLSQQSYSSTFSGNELFISDYQINIDNRGEQKTLPVVVYIEMARAAVSKALPAKQESSILELHNIVCGQPFVISENGQIDIALFAKGDDQVDYEIYSKNKEEEVIHCQGQAIFNHQPTPAKLNIEQLKGQIKGRLEASELYSIFTKAGINYGSAYKAITSAYHGEEQLLVQLILPTVVDADQNDYLLHPSMIEGVMQASAGLIGDLSQSQFQPSLPSAFELVSIISACTKEMFAWVRYSQASQSEAETAKVDIDLCDQKGNVCVQMRGVVCQYGTQNLIDEATSQTISSAIPQVSEQIPISSVITPKITFNEPQNQTFKQIGLHKPTGISLTSPEVLRTEMTEKASSGKGSITLTNTSYTTSSGEHQVFASPSVNLYDCGNGIFSIQVSAEENNTLERGLIGLLLRALEMARQTESIKVLMIKGTNRSFLSGGREHYNEAVGQKLHHAITSFPYPVIAAMQGDATGVGFLIGALCDFMICSRTGRYYYTSPQEGLYPSESEYQLFEERFGGVRATDFLYISEGSTGNQLKDKGWTCSILNQDQVEAHALVLASKLAKKSGASLRLLKQHLARHINDLVGALTVVDPLNANKQTDKSRAGSKITSTSKQILLETHAKSVLVIRVCDAKKGSGMKTLVADLTDIFAQLNNSSKYKSIVLVSDYLDFLSEKVSVNDVLDFQRLVLESPLPVIAALDSNAKGLAWFISQFCDACIYNAKGSYSSANIGQSSELARQAAMIFSYRFGNYFGKEILLTGNEYSGIELQQKVGTINSVVQEQVLTTALKLAENWSKLPLDTIVSWKKQMIFSIREKITNQPAWSEPKEEAIETLSTLPILITLKSNVITATAYPEGILVVKMEDREAKNMFSDAIIQGINEVFDHIEKSPSYKVVILTGYEQYFASGGTKETLLSIQEGKTKFTDNKIYQITMTCKVPVIAAMQGHGIGAGWSLGMFADFIVFSEESKYFSPYMNYGFTPGAGATFIFPEKIGYDLSRETLLTGQEYNGREFKERGLLIPVIQREQVNIAALDLAKQIANSSRSQLIAFKHQMTHHFHKPLEEAYELELGMHEKTFVGQSETLAQIENNFIQANSHIPIKANPDEILLSPAIVDPMSSNENMASVSANLRKLLAQELHLHEHEIEENTQFVDLGLDSITGVTWIRKINEKYKTSIEATKVYSYSTLSQLSRYVKEEVEKVDTLTNKSEVSISANSASYVQQIDILPTVTASLRQLLAQELHLQEHEIEENTQFVDLGLDSITGVTWIRKINEKYKTSIEATKVYSYSTLSQLSRYVKEEAEKLVTLSNKSELSIPLKLQNKIVSQPAVKKLSSWRNKISSRINAGTSSVYQPIAVIGMAGQFPKAKNLEEFWQNIAQGKNCISEISQKRWDINTYYKEGGPVPGKTNGKWMGALEEYDLFDPLFFNISPTEAENMDPQQRVFLQTCWHSIENSGYNPKSLSGTKCGVFVGCGPGDYHKLSQKHQLSAQGFTGSASSVLAARISYFLNLQGPCLSIDTACSSSLVAIASACDSLNSGSSDIALAGGVNVLSGPSMHIMCSQTSMLSPDGKCFTFDQKANGFVPGEGVGVVMLKRLADAEKDHDAILGVIQGWGVNQDGKTNGITAPNEESQTRLEQEVYDKYHIDPEHIQLVEAHGTGTKLGDPIEVGALKATFKKYTQKKEYCALGSVKSNIGHCLTAAGVASFVKVLLALKHKQLPPTINFDHLNEHIGLKESPFYVNNQLQKWELKDSQRRQAAVSAFGFGGTNAHIVLAEYLPPIEAKSNITFITQNNKIIIPLSARTAEQLQQKASDLLDYIRQEGQTIEFVELAYTLQMGREAMGERLGFMVSSIGELAEKLKSYTEGKENIENVYQGQVKRNKEGMSIISGDDDMKEMIVDQWIAQKKLSKLLDLWVKGLELDWHKLYGNNKPRRINLPVYPFAKERYWFEVEETLMASKILTTFSVLHPLLHSNTSNLRQQSYSSTFNGKEFFLNDHQINGYKVLPAAAYLEMVRAAVEQATSIQQESIILELYNIIWTQPIIVTNDKDVSIALFEDDDETIDYEIYSIVADEEIIHNRGKVILNSKSSLSNKLDIEKLKEKMGKDKLEVTNFYSILTQMGFNYGIAMQALSEVYKGTNQLLAKINIPAIIENNQSDYYLHPSLLESAIYTSIVLITDFNQLPVYPLLPDTLETMTIISACTKEMYVWVHNSQGINSNAVINKIDIDLCDVQGNICVQMKGLTFQPMAVNANDLDGRQQLLDTNELSKLKSEQSREISKILYYKEDWQEEPLDGMLSEEANMQYVIFADSEFEKEIANSNDSDLLRNAIFVYQAERYKKISERIYNCRPNSINDVQQILNDVTLGTHVQGVTPSIAIIYSWAKDQKAEGIHALFNLFRAIKGSVHYVSNVILVGRYDSLTLDSCWDYSWIGFERSLKQTLSKTQISILYTDSTSPSVQQMVDASKHRGVIRYKNNQRFILSYKPSELNKTTKQSIVKQNGHYLITGGCGALGFKFAQYLAKNYQAKLLLLGRHPLTENIQKQLDALTQAGAKEIHYYSIDISDEKSLVSLARNLPFDIFGIIHAAGVEASKPYFESTKDDIDQVILPKSIGTILLDKVFGEQPLDFVCYFSSTAALFGDTGSCDYAIANRFQMAYALYRQQTMPDKGKTAVINWPLWQEGGMGFKDKVQSEQYIKMIAQDFGQELLTTQMGLDIWQDILQSDQLQTLVMVAKPSRVEKFLTKIYHDRQPSQMVTFGNTSQYDGNVGGYKYANKVEEVYSLVLPSVESKMEYLTFCPFESKKPGFSMSRAYLNPKKYPEDRRYIHEKQTEMRQVLFCKVHFEKINSILDFGCGHGTDIIQIGTLFPHMQVHGFTITGNQANLGNQRIALKNLSSKVKIYHKDSTKDAFPSKYDLVFGIEVCPHIDDKAGLFKNICNSLNENGTILLMDVISNQKDAFVDPNVGMNIPSQEDWIKLISQFNLEIDEFIDVSPQISNFLYDPDVYSNVKRLPEAIQKTYFGYADFSLSLEKGIMSYVLIKLKRNNQLSEQELKEYNWKKIKNPIPYPDALEDMFKHQRVVYPPVDSMANKPQSNEIEISSFLESKEQQIDYPSTDRLDSNIYCTNKVSVSLQQLQQELKTSLAEILHLKISVIDINQSFGDLGLESFLGLEWVTAINTKYGTQLPNIVVYDYPTVKELAIFLEKEIKKLPATFKQQISTISFDESSLQLSNKASISLQQLQQELKTSLAEILHLKTSVIDINQSFGDLGLESFLGLEWVTAINTKYGTQLPNIVVYDYPTVKELAIFLEKEIRKLPATSQKQIQTFSSEKSSVQLSNYQSGRKINRISRTIRRKDNPSKSYNSLDSDKIAIVGMSGRYPQANNLQKYWDNLVQGKNSIVEIPSSRWDVNKYYDPDPNKTDKICSKWLGVMDDIDCFDPLFFRISPQEAENMDPQHRLFLQESYKAFEDAGYSSSSLSNKKCGVYLGIAHNEYSLLRSKNNVASSQITSDSSSIAAARIAYHLNLKGPAIAIDTACSSSLVAIHLACQGLLNHETNMALAGGISLWLTPESYQGMSQAGMLSPDGQCKTFDDSANGIVVGEGVGAIVLKRLEDAKRDNDTIYGVILGSGINQDGKSNGITAPSVNSQIELIRDIYSKYKIDPEIISYVETHGTGTKLGDPIELKALDTVFKEKTEKKNYCAIASVKTNIGHTSAAAGIASLHKVLLSMQHQTLVSTLNVTKENSHFDFKNSPFYINKENRFWEAGSNSLRRAGVSAFGFSGTNAHLVLEEYQQQSNGKLSISTRAFYQNEDVVIPLSARTSEQLKQKVHDLLDFISSPDTVKHRENQRTQSIKTIDLNSIAYTLQVGREEMEVRLGFLVNSVDQLIDRLKAYIDGQHDVEGTFQGKVKPNEDTLLMFNSDEDMQKFVDQCMAHKQLSKLGDLWVKGLDIDWNMLYSDRKPQRISLPTYPFAKERYWVENTLVNQGLDDKVKTTKNLESIEDIINKIDNDSIDTLHAVQLLKNLS